MQIGELVWYITGDTSGLTKAQKQANSAIIETQTNMKKFGETAKKVGDSLVSVGKNLTAAVTLPIIGLGAAALKLATDFESSSLRFRKTFEDDADRAVEAVQRLNEEYGTGIADAQKLLGSTGALLKGLGATSSEALDMAVATHEAAVALAAYNGVSEEAATQALEMAYLGQTRGLKQLKIAIDDTEVSARLLAKGQQDLTGEALELAKAQATLELVYEKGADAIDSFSEFQETLSDQFGDLVASVKDLGIQFGQILIPYAKEAVKLISGWVDTLKKLDPEQQKAIIAIAAVAAAIGPLLIVGGKTLIIIGQIAQAMPILTNALGALGTAASGASVGVAALTAGGLVSTLAVLGPIAAGLAAVTILTLDYAAAQEELNTKVQESQEIQEKYSDRIKMSQKETEELVMSMEGFFSRNASGMQNAAEFEQLVVEFAKSRNIEYKTAVRLLQNSTALTEEQAKWAKELQREFADVTTEISNMEVGLATVAYYQAQGTKQLQEQKKLLEESKARQKALADQKAAEAKKTYEEKIALIDAGLNAARSESAELQIEIDRVSAWRFNSAADEAKRIEYLRVLEEQKADTVEQETLKQIELTNQLAFAKIKAASAGLNDGPRTVGGIDFSGLGDGADDAFARIGDLGDQTFTALKYKALQETDEMLNGLGDKYSTFASIAASVFSGLASIFSGITDARIADNDAAMQKELESLGIAEESTMARAARELEEAKSTGNQEVIADKEKALKKIQIEDEYAKKKKKIEYEGALAQWGFQLGNAIATLPMLILNGWNTGMGAGWPLALVMAPLMAGVAGAAGAAQIAAIAAAKPSAPSYATGGIVPATAGGQMARVAENGGNELLLNDGDTGRPLLNQFADAVAARSGNGGGMMNLILNLDGLQIASNVVEYLNNGVVTIDMKRAARA